MELNDPNLTIIQASDLHIAMRNDVIAKIIYAKTNDSKIFRNIINPNDNLRRFVEFVNRYSDKIGLVVFTGDIVDYVIKCDRNIKYSDCNYEDTNWHWFYNIIKDMKVPFSISVGNHDYRAYHYDLRWFSIYKKLNISTNEIACYTDPIKPTIINSIFSNRNVLKIYEDLGNKTNFFIDTPYLRLIFLDTGLDSIKNIKDLVDLLPTLSGVSVKQLKFFEDLIESKSDSQKLLLFTHAPVNAKKGGISNGSDIIMKLCEENNIYTFAGHTHMSEIKDRYITTGDLATQGIFRVIKTNMGELVSCNLDSLSNYRNFLSVKNSIIP